MAGSGEVGLRDVDQDDLPMLFEHQIDPEATRMANVPARDHDAFIAHWTKILADGSGRTQAILVDGEVAGNVVLWGDPGERLVGYWVGKDHWGRGVATAALAQFLIQVPSDRSSPTSPSTTSALGRSWNGAASRRRTRTAASNRTVTSSS